MSALNSGTSSEINQALKSRKQEDNCSFKNQSSAWKLTKLGSDKMLQNTEEIFSEIKKHNLFLIIHTKPLLESSVIKLKKITIIFINKNRSLGNQKCVILIAEDTFKPNNTRLRCDVLRS